MRHVKRTVQIDRKRLSPIFHCGGLCIAIALYSCAMTEQINSTKFIGYPVDSNLHSFGIGDIHRHNQTLAPMGLVYPFLGVRCSLI